MKILMIYRSKDSGPSIRRVFEPIENELKKTNHIDSVFLPSGSASLIGICKNISFIRDYLRGKSYDIIHITGHVYYLAYVLRKCNTVITVHDLGFYTNYRNSLRKTLLYWLCIYPLKLAKHVTYISKKSYDEANGIIKITNDQSVVYDPVDPTFDYSHKEINKEYPTILHLGTKPNKNLSRVIEAVSKIPCTLHIIGNISETEKERIQELDLNVILEHDVSDQEIMESYQQCDVVSFPSLYEGFGMPIIEGQAIGRPIVTSNRMPMKEIAANAAVIVDPESVESIREGFVEAIENSDALIKNGLQNVKKFSVQEISQQYYTIYKKLLDV